MHTANPLDNISRWTPPVPNVPIPKASRAERETKKAAKRAEVETIKREANKQERSKVSARFRRMIFDRDGWKCVRCGANPISDPEVKLVLAHVRPIAQGGQTTEENCQCWCSTCNAGQGAALVWREEKAHDPKLAELTEKGKKNKRSGK